MTHKFYCRLFMIVLCLALAVPASANWMGGFVLDHGAASYLGNSEQARVTFDFEVTNANGARFVVDGMLDGSVLPFRTWNGSPNYAMGTLSTHSNYITFNSGTVAVDQYRIAMFDPITTDILLEMYLPVEYFFGPNAVNNFQLNYTSPSWILNGDDLTIGFDYQTDEVAGARVSARPYTDGSLSVGYGASGLGLLPLGTGTGSQYFTFPNLDADVDEIRILMVTADQSTTLLEFFIPVDLHWGPHSISNITFDPPYPDCLAWDQPVTVEFDYATSDPGGCYIWTLGLDESHSTIINQAYAGSALEPVSGHIVRHYRMLPDNGEGEFRYAHFSMSDATNTNSLLQFDIPATYPYGPNAIQNVSYSPAAPAVLDHGTHVDVAFDYVTNEAAGVRVYSHPFSYDGIVPPYGVSGSILYTGSGSGTTFFTVTAGDYLVNNVRMKMNVADNSSLLMEHFFAGNFTYGGVGGVTPVPDTPVALGPVLQQNYPNPFNPQTTIKFELPAPAAMSLRVFDLSGRLVRVLLDGQMVADGPQEAIWDGRDDSGSRVASGTYFYRLEGGQLSETRSMVLVK